MAEPGPTPQAPTPQATVRKSRRLQWSYVWLVPIIAAAVGGYLFYRTEIDVGPTIEIGFADGTNVSTGSKVVYRGVQVGTVQSVELDAGLQHVNAVVQLHKPAAGLARAGSQFWIVEPRVSVGQVTGLDTLLSGSYIEVAPGDGAATTRFVGLANPPVVSPGAGDMVFFLEADDAASLEIGSPILYRGIGVGKIAAVALPQDGSRVQLKAAIPPEHASLVRTNSVFWRTSGVHFDLQPLDPKIDISSVESLIRGGVAFATPGPPGEPAGANALFELLDQPPAGSVVAPKPGLHVVLSAAQLGSVAAGNPVYYREVQVGEVMSTGSRATPAPPRSMRWSGSATRRWSRKARCSGTPAACASTPACSAAPRSTWNSRALLAGGVAFATPEQQGTPAKDGSQFVLHDPPKDKWLTWQPVVQLAPARAPIELAESFSVEDMTPAAYTVTTASHVREGPDTIYPVLTTLSEDTTVTVAGKVAEPRLVPGRVGAATGYVWAKLLEPAQAAAAHSEEARSACAACQRALVRAAKIAASIAVVGAAALGAAAARRVAIAATGVTAVAALAAGGGLEASWGRADRILRTSGQHDGGSANARSTFTCRFMAMLSRWNVGAPAITSGTFSRSIERARRARADCAGRVGKLVGGGQDRLSPALSASGCRAPGREGCPDGRRQHAPADPSEGLPGAGLPGRPGRPGRPPRPGLDRGHGKARHPAQCGRRRRAAAFGAGRPGTRAGRAFRLDGEPLGANRYSQGDEHLTIDAPPAAFALEITSRTRPDSNTALEGLYISGGVFCTQCEAEGFRNITYYLDRPDVMAASRPWWRTERSYPVLLPTATWSSPARCPAAATSRSGTTRSRSPVPVRAGGGRSGAARRQFITAADATLRSRFMPRPRHRQVRPRHGALKRAMQWDEERFGREYDLDRFMIVAVNDFNMGAMENKGLNVFNTKYVLARPDTATDAASRAWRPSWPTSTSTTGPATA